MVEAYKDLNDKIPMNKFEIIDTYEDLFYAIINDRKVIMIDLDGHDCYLVKNIEIHVLVEGLKDEYTLFIAEQ